MPLNNYADAQVMDVVGSEDLTNSWWPTKDAQMPFFVTVQPLRAQHILLWRSGISNGTKWSLSRFATIGGASDLRSILGPLRRRYNPDDIHFFFFFSYIYSQSAYSLHELHRSGNLSYLFGFIVISTWANSANMRARARLHIRAMWPRPRTDEKRYCVE